MFNRIKSQEGFTLIELAAVIVIVAIMAFFAVPRFVNMTADARDGKAQEFVGALNAEEQNFYAKALLDGTDLSTGTPIWTNDIDVAGSVLHSFAESAGGYSSTGQNRLGVNCTDVNTYSTCQWEFIAARVAESETSPATWRFISSTGDIGL